MSDRYGSAEGEFDLMAYADGVLDEDPARKALVERRLRASPADAARVEAYRAQNAALRRRYGRRVEDPVPDRLYAVLDRQGWRPFRAAAAAAAVLALTSVAGVSGWMVGQSDRSAKWLPDAFLDDSRIGHVTSGLRTGPVAAPVAAGSQAPLDWLSESISLNVRVPDLSARGFTLERKETLPGGDERMVRLSYASAEGDGFSLFLRPWWERRNPGIELVRRDGAWLAYWRDGPLASVIVSRLPEQEVRELAREVRRAMQEEGRRTPGIQAEPVRSGLPGLATGAAAGHIHAPARSPAPSGMDASDSSWIIRTN